MTSTTALRASNHANHRTSASPTALHLVDIENLAGEAYPSATSAVATLREYASCGGHRDGDLAFLSANRHLIESVVFDLPFACRPSTAPTGPDGAELALLAAAPVEWVCRRFTRIVIGSGDHKFADLARTALAAGVEVVIVGRPGTIARIYFELGCEIRFLGAPDVATLTGRPEQVWGSEVGHVA